MKKCTVKRLIKEALEDRDAKLKAEHIKALLKALQEHGIRVDIRGIVK